MTSQPVMLASTLLFGGDGVDRRGFIKALFQGGVCLPLMPAMALAMPQHKVLLQESPVAGFQYDKGERLFGRLQTGTPLRLVREAENRYDRNAVAVYFQGEKLGFVPRSDNCAISQLMDRGKQLSARIVKVSRVKTPWERIRFEVSLDG